ncbi:heparan-alpha-glucosaminide N-acetyltransferase [Paracoccus sp. Z330]|uniref:Heparan-alpha-glucosaminide N-acetyltransferase n=1 Tax=Paracoccus onchidii TaxID=3017813 RepID=A0ABT4ZKS7_9RHOB|nr:heparan-alpha-glucosaminide N-acetyltransferase [Paracoccus onchidii]MDB6179687.1 heparan-alpha-glucosaminide N-acetyltransferase [Paracoccus onchidii]
MTDTGSTMPRILAVDIGRTVALVGMVVFHFARDLEIFGILPPGTTISDGWYVLARVIAGSFFFFAGMSLVLAHGEQIRWRSFWRRLAIVGLAASAISIATFAAMPSRFIYFGILHSIAVCSLAGLALLHVPPILTAIAAAGIIALHLSGFHPLQSVFWSFTGLSRAVRPALDLLPIVPWVSVLLVGIVFAKLWNPKPSPSTVLKERLAWLGRHTLSIYLLHQPILLGVIWLTLKVFQ